MIAEQHKRPEIKQKQEQAENGIRAKLFSEVRNHLGRFPQVVQNSDSQRHMPIHGVRRIRGDRERSGLIHPEEAVMSIRGHY
jgi:hypothetical protein